MIISASRRTDIPAFYGDWFIKRIQDGYVLVRNPINPHQVSRISLKREDVDCIVFWTKNPAGMLPGLHLLEGYPFYFLFTLNPYDSSIEKRVPYKAEVIETFRILAGMIGPQRVIWRYDPILISDKFSMDYHVKYFEAIAKRLFGSTSRCIISFVDYYKKIEKNLKDNGIKEASEETKRTLAARISDMAGRYGISVETCAEEIDLSSFGIKHARCIDPELIAAISGMPLPKVAVKDKNQRAACGCMESADIGTYDTCRHGCIYCYANCSRKAVAANMERYDVDSPLLCSKLTEEDRIFDRKPR